MCPTKVVGRRDVDVHLLVWRLQRREGEEARNGEDGWMGRQSLVQERMEGWYERLGRRETLGASDFVMQPRR